MAYKVIIADDEPIMKKAMQTLIDWDKLECELVYSATNGQEVMRELDVITPDILILDIQMPGVNGIEIAKYIWEQRLPVKVILLTAYADFSYAQSGIKYNVVDYVIKTGAFEELLQAIDKAKDQIREEESKQTEQDQSILIESFFNAVFDESLYEKDEIETKFQGTGLDLGSGYVVMALHFRMSEDKKRDYTYKSLQNFLKMVFETHMVYGAAVQKNMYIVVLRDVSEPFQKDIQNKCLQIIEMMDNFMKMYVYIGISKRSENVLALKEMYEEAEYAVRESFFNEESKINYYKEYKKESRKYLTEVYKYQEELRYLIKKGKTEEALAAFHKLIAYQKAMEGNTNTALDSGISILTWCRKVLADFDKTLDDLMGGQTDFSKMIYQCRHVSEYTEILEKVIGVTTKYIAVAVSKKNIIVYECEKYIEENYEKCITVSEVSRSIGVSLSYLSRIFKEATGNTIINFINEKKVEKAKEYLGRTDMKIYEVAEALGFENTTYFSYFFKKYTGISPKEYKEDGGV